MASTSMNLPASAAMRNVTMNVRVTGLRTLRVRMWFAGKLLLLAAWVAGCGIEIDTAGTIGEACEDAERAAKKAWRRNGL
jgi:hypothetical protein